MPRYTQERPLLGSVHNLQSAMQMCKVCPKCNEKCDQGLAVAIERPGAVGIESHIQSFEDSLGFEVRSLAPLQMKLCYCILRPMGSLFRRFRSQQDPPLHPPMNRLHGLITACCEGGSLRNWLLRRTQPRSSADYISKLQLPLRTRLEAAAQRR
jgi:hypothetical protein